MASLGPVSRGARLRNAYRGKLPVSRVIIPLLLALVFFVLQLQTSRRQNAPSPPANGNANSRQTMRVDSSVRHDFRDARKPVSIVFDKRAKTGSTSVNAALREVFRGKKFINCGHHSEAQALEKMYNQTAATGFDVFDCHIKTDWPDRLLIERRANAPVAWMTVTRDPFERLMSHWKHVVRGGKKKGNVTKCVDIRGDDVSNFYRGVHEKYLLSEFGDVQTLYHEISTGKICSRWDVVLESEALADDVSNFLGYTNLSQLNVAPSVCGNVTHDEALVIKAELHDEYAHHRALLACKKMNKRLRMIDGDIALIGS